MKARIFFVTGTDTEVGKTYVTALLAEKGRQAGLRVGAYKPVCSGAVTREDGSRYWEDVERLRASIGRTVSAERICPQCFAAPLAPPVAARLEGKAVNSDLLTTGLDWWRDRFDVVLVEGAGGLLSPVTDCWLVADLVQQLGRPPLIVVARNGLGTINHTLLTLEVAAHRGLPVRAVVLSDVSGQGSDQSKRSNAQEIAKRISCPLFVLPHQSTEILSLNGHPRTLDLIT